MGGMKYRRLWRDEKTHWLIGKLGDWVQARGGQRVGEPREPMSIRSVDSPALQTNALLVFRVVDVAIVVADVFRDFPARLQMVGLRCRPRFGVGLGILDRKIIH